VLTSIEGRSVIVTGASRGIGKDIARVFAAKGARVLIAARDPGQAELAAAQIRAEEDKSLGHASNLAEPFELPRCQ
jgi:3-oxoacyl-[acyl-carrier protein] reductase